MMNKLLPLIGSFILTYILYRRLFKLRLPKDILPITDNLFILFYLMLFTISSTMLLIMLYRHFYQDNTGSSHVAPNKFALKIKSIMHSPYSPLKLWSESLIAFDSYIKHHIPSYDASRTYLDIVLVTLGKFAYKHKQYLVVCLIIITIFCQSVVLICFSIDVIIFCKFHYFYKVLWLLLLPMTIKYLIHSFTVFIQANLEALDRILIIKAVTLSEYTSNPCVDVYKRITIEDWFVICNEPSQEEHLAIHLLSPIFIENYPNNDNEFTLMLCVDSLNDFFAIKAFLGYYDKYKPFQGYFDLLRYFTYTMCWGYILLLLCHSINQ